jgi:transposase
MSGNVRPLTRKQTQFIEALSVGQSIVAAASAIGVSEKTAHRWLKLPAVQAERTRLEAELQAAEEAEIKRILTTGYAAVHERVKALDYQAREMEQPYTSETGKTYHLRNSPEHMREWRGLLDDIAKETGGRVKKQEIEHSGLIDMLNAEHASLVADLEALPDVSPGQSQTSPRGTTADPA